MNKWLALVVASAFAFGSASGFAADAVKKKEDLTAEQKSEIRDRVERMKSDRVKADTAKPAEPAKAAAPKRTSGNTKAVKPGKTLPKVAKAPSAIKTVKPKA